MRRKLLTIMISVFMVIGLLPVTASAAGYITNVQINVTVPAEGAAPDTAASIITSPSNAAVILGGKYAPEWTDANGEPVTGKFMAGHVYYYHCLIQAKSGYAFDCDGEGYYSGSVSSNGSVYCIAGDRGIVDRGLSVDIMFAPGLCIGGHIYSKDQLRSNISGSGWKWNAANNQLTLNGYNGNFIKAYEQLSIVLADGTDNRITVPEGELEYGIYTFFDCNISGNGNLSIKMANESYECIWSDSGDVYLNTGGNVGLVSNDDGIFASGSVIISGSGDVSISAGYVGIYSDFGSVIDEGSGDLTITSGWDGIAVNIGDLVLSGTGAVNVRSNDDNAICFYSEGYGVKLNGSGMPVRFNAAYGYKAVYNLETGGSPVGGSSIGYYNKVSGSPESYWVVYETDSVLPFGDVSPDIWFYNDVVYAYENGLMNGTSAVSFNPNGTTTRAMIVTILYRMEGSPYISGGNSFADVSSGMWYSDAITWANKNGIVNGYSSSSFGPNDSIMREQMAAILYRYAKYKGYNVSASKSISSFSDAYAVSDYAVTPIKWAYACGLINGTSASTLSPKDGATRAQAAAILHRFCIM